MSDLDNEFVLSEVLPEWNLVVEVVSREEPLVADFWECVDSVSALNTRREETRQQDEGKQSMRESLHNASVSIVISHVPQSDHRFLRPPQQVQALP